VIVDGHLDLAWNALALGRRLEEQPPEGSVISLPALREAGVGLVFGTLFAEPAGRVGLADDFTYRQPREASLIARAQVGWYQGSGITLIRDREQLAGYLRGWRRGQLAAVLLMEGADPVESPADVARWAALGVRIVGPAWAETRYSAGTGKPGGLTPAGVELLREMAEAELILDLSHLADQAVDEALGLWRGPVIASHSNARALTPGDRQLPDSTLAEVGRRGGVVGVSFYRGHLRPDDGAARLGDVAAHVLHVARATGGPEHVGLGSDLDGGFGAKDAAIPNLGRLDDLGDLLNRSFNRAQVEGIMAGNWLELLLHHLAPVPADRSEPKEDL
jgi:membrane dipeptidase